MSVFHSLQEARDFFSKDLFATSNNMTLDALTEDGAVCGMEITERHMNAANRVMGAVYYTMADFAFAVANNYDMEEAVTVTLSSQISFLSAAKSNRLFAEARVLKEGYGTTFYTVEVMDELGTQIAVVSSSGYRMHRT